MALSGKGSSVLLLLSSGLTTLIYTSCPKYHVSRFSDRKFHIPTLSKYTSIAVHAPGNTWYIKIKLDNMFCILILALNQWCHVIAWNFRAHWAIKALSKSSLKWRLMTLGILIVEDYRIALFLAWRQSKKTFYLNIEGKGGGLNYLRCSPCNTIPFVVSPTTILCPYPKIHPISSKTF